MELQIWDTAGQEKFRSITRAYYRDAAGALLVYDVTKRHTFGRLSSWLEDIRQQDDTSVIVVGNKWDAGENIRVVNAEEGEEFAKSNGCLFIEASAKTTVNVATTFHKTTERICEKMGYVDLEEVDEALGINIWKWRGFRIGKNIVGEGNFAGMGDTTTNMICSNEIISHDIKFITNYLLFVTKIIIRL
ncbi:ras-related protein Rab-2-B-like [Nicotiana sylvestris]|uniref:ras-related protein Rab-2-B-like n=1 Tax=Nicotiana sylvestris TaxID=4096 RepID=UPI00388C88C4